MPETTENYHRIPVSEGHDDHEIRTIVISDKDGIKALYCVDDKEIITYLFDVDKWTMEDAKEWVEEHKEDDLNIEEQLRFRGIDMKITRKERDAITSQVRFKSHGQIRFKDLSSGSGESELLVRGLFTSDKMDEVGDIITKDATVGAIRKWRQWGNIRTMHDYPSGRVEAIGEDDGLDWNEIVTVPVDKGTIDLIKGGVLKAYSVGIIPRKYDINEEALEEGSDGWFLPLIIHEYDLVEISYVDHPANYAAAISEVSEGKDYGGQRSVLFKMMPGEKDKMDSIENVPETTDYEEKMDKLLEENPEEYLKELQGDEYTGLEGELEKEEELDDVAVVEDVVEDSVESDDEDHDPYENAELGDVLLAVHAVQKQMSEMFDFVTSNLVEMIMNSKELESEMDGVAESETEDESDEGLSDEEFAEKVAERVASLLAPDVENRASAVTMSQEPEEEELDAIGITRKYMGLSREERRRAMAITLNNRGK